MRSDLLLDRLDTLVRTPNDVAKLESAILDLAARGQLVAEDPEDESASVLVERIKAAKKSLAEQGRIRKRKTLPGLGCDELPYQLPKGWTWIRLDEIADIASGTAKGRNLSAHETVMMPYLRVANVQRGYLDLSQIKEIEIKVVEKAKYLLEEGDLLLTEGGDADKLGRSAIWHGQVPDCIHQNHIFRARMHLEELGAEWAMLCTNSPYGRQYFLGSAKQTTNLASINMTQLRHFPVPLPPLAEQKRIVARVDELLAQTRAQAAQLQAADEALVPAAQASFQALTDAPDSSEQREAWQRISAAFDALTADPRTLDALKQAVLQLAVQGKLVPQDPGDEPASVLLEQIRARKERLLKEGAIKRTRKLPAISAGELPYELPRTWIWARLQDVYDVRDGTHDTPKYVDDGIPFVTSKNLKNGRVDLSDVKYITPDDHARFSERSRVERHDILFAMIGSIGNPAIVEESNYSIKNVALFKYYDQLLSNPKYLFFFLKYASSAMKRTASGGVQSFVSLTFLRQHLIPLPPLAEQKRIVAKVESLLALCDKLAAEVVAAEEVRGRLLQSILNQGGDNDGR